MPAFDAQIKTLSWDKSLLIVCIKRGSYGAGWFLSNNQAAVFTGEWNMSPSILFIGYHFNIVLQNSAERDDSINSAKFLGWMAVKHTTGSCVEVNWMAYDHLEAYRTNTKQMAEVGEARDVLFSPSFLSLIPIHRVPAQISNGYNWDMSSRTRVE